MRVPKHGGDKANRLKREAIERFEASEKAKRDQFCCVRECRVCGGDCDGGDDCPGPLWYDEDGNQHHGDTPELPADHDEPEERPFPWGCA